MKFKGLLVTLKGIAMGAADVVPGVSGGTIAFITGIYEELIDSIKSLNIKTLKMLLRGEFSPFWKAVNGNFLIRLLTGIAISILSLAKLITYLLDYHPVLIWSFFFGLILASIVLIAKDIKIWKTNVYISIVVGSIVSFLITIATPTQSPDSLPFLFFAGFVAIIAMILPGISGAFILLLLGAYSTVIGTLNNFREGLAAMNSALILSNGSKIFIFILGCAAGLMAFSRVLSWMFHHHKDSTLALLTGFMVGSLNKVWPWKKTVITRIAHEGKENEAVIPFIQENVWPWNFGKDFTLEQSLSIIPDPDPKILSALLLMIFGIVLIGLLHRFSPDNE